MSRSFVIFGKTIILEWDVIKSKILCILKALIPPLRRLLITIVIIALVAIISVIQYNSPPRTYINEGLSFNWTFDPRTLRPLDTNFTYNVLMDTHCHSVYSDGLFTPEQLIEWHIANGYNAMVVTDHNTVQGSIVAQRIAREKYNNSIKVITGMEWTNCRCHLNFIGINETLTSIKWPTDQEIQDIINQVHQLGGLVVYNHNPFSTWAGLDQPTLQQFADWGVDYFDIANTLYYDFQTWLWAKSNGFPIVAANDFHGTGTSLGWTIFNIPNTTYNESAPITADYFTEEQLFQAFKQKNTSIIFNVLGSGYDTNWNLKVNPKYRNLEPWINIGEFFHGYYTMERGAYSFVDGNCDANRVTVESAYIKTTVWWFVVLFIIGEIIRAIGLLIYRLIKKRINLNKKNNVKKGVDQDDDDGRKERGSKSDI